MKKSEIRTKIENILKRKIRRCFIDQRKNNIFRMKLTTLHPATNQEIKEIESLSNVIKVGFVDSTHPWQSYSGITIHFNCRPKDIKL